VTCLMGLLRTFVVVVLLFNLCGLLCYINLTGRIASRIAGKRALSLPRLLLVSQKAQSSPSASPATKSSHAASRLRGVAPGNRGRYAGTHFTCFDGSMNMSRLKVNDNYCDCTDGSDEPGTIFSLDVSTSRCWA
jgi:hypothetical protein